MEIYLPCAASIKICNLSSHVRVCVAFLPFVTSKETNIFNVKVHLSEQLRYIMR